MQRVKKLNRYSKIYCRVTICVNDPEVEDLLFVIDCSKSEITPQSKTITT